MSFLPFFSPFGHGPHDHLEHQILEALASREEDDLGDAVDEARGVEGFPDEAIESLEGLRGDRARLEAEAAFIPRDVQDEREVELQIRAIELSRALFGYIPPRLVSPMILSRLPPKLREEFEASLKVAPNEPSLAPMDAERAPEMKME